MGGPGNTFQWGANDTDIAGETAETLELMSVDASFGGNYSCVVTNAAGSDSDSTFLFIAPYFILQPVDQETANGSSVTLQCVAEAFPRPSYQWARADGELIGDIIVTNTNTLLIDPIFFGEQGDYYCNATSHEGVARSQNATIFSELLCIKHRFLIIICS